MTTATDNESRIRAQFEKAITEHELVVLKDDSLYRHLRCQKPETWTYGFDVITWPGYLAVAGDIGHFTFSRTRDMFEFFRQDSGRINPDYWSEKLQGPGPAHQAVMEFDERAYHAYVQDHELSIVDDWGGPFTKHDASRLLVEAGIDPYDLPSLERYSTQFLWCCHGIVWAIAQYDARTVATS